MTPQGMTVKPSQDVFSTKSFKLPVVYQERDQFQMTRAIPRKPSKVKFSIFNLVQTELPDISHHDKN